LLTLIHGINVRQAFFLCTLFSAISFAAAAVRLAFLSSARQYRPFIGILVLWSAIAVVAISVNVRSKLYFQIFWYATPVSWLLYLFVARDLYQRIFDKFRGIAFAGRTCLYLSAAFLLASQIASVMFSQGRINPSFGFAAIAFVDRCVLFGVSFFLLLLVGVIVRYPISIQKNLVVNCLAFSAVLFVQSMFQVADQWTLYAHSSLWNTMAAAFETVCVSAWALLLSKAGDTTIVRIRQHLKPELEAHLMGQLNAFNGVLLRATRK
jgi:hypothetical protein